MSLNLVTRCNLIIVILISVVTTVSNGQRFSLSRDLPLKNLSSDFKMDKEFVRGEWRAREDWKGTFCNGHYEYLMKANAKVQDIDFEEMTENKITVKAKFRDLYFRGDGEVRSSYTGCVTLNGWIGIGAEDAQLRADVELAEDFSRVLKVKILSTEFGKLDMGSIVPSWFEDRARKLVNNTMQHVWGSELGTWLNDKINEIIKQKFPKPDRNDYVEGYTTEFAAS